MGFSLGGGSGNYERVTQRHAMALDKEDRARSERLFQQMFGVLSPQGGSSSSSSGFNTGDSLGVEARLASLLDDPDSIKKTGAYNFRVGQGQEALQRSLGARGLLGSGNRLTELTKYGQDMASQEYENQFGRLSNLLGMKSNERSNMFGSLSNVLGGGALGRGGTSDIWNAYGSNRNAQIVGGYEQNRPKSWQKTDFGWGYQ